MMHVMITGTSSGIGRAAAELFLERGFAVSGIDVLPAAIDDPAYTHYIADVSRPETWEGVIPQDLRPEILVNNAGVQTPVMPGQAAGDPASGCSSCGEDAYRDIEVNLIGMINVTERYAIRNENIRSVVNVGSASGHTGSEFPVYAASKGGVLAYTKNAALRLAPHATCNSIDPGGVTTQLNRAVMEDPGLWERIMDLTPMKRWAEPREIAEWIYFVSVINRTMTGQNLLIDGGEAGRAEFIWPEQS